MNGTQPTERQAMTKRYACCDHCPKGPHVDHERPCSARCGGSVEIPSKAPSSPMETTAGDSGIVGRLGEIISAQVDVIAERDATIERLWAQLNEATNVPDDRYADEHCGDRP